MTSLYPKRQRCAACRCFFGPVVLAGQWCSYECAGHPAPSLNPARWPRSHYRTGKTNLSQNQRFAKTPYLSLAEAEFVTLEGSGLQAYFDDYCLMWHVGHARQELDKGGRLSEKATASEGAKQ